MKYLLQSLVIIFSSLIPAFIWATLAVPPGTDGCIDPKTDADVIFKAVALETHWPNTEMNVVEIVKGEVPKGKIIFRHSRPPSTSSLEPIMFGRYFQLDNGKSYLIYAKKTKKANAFTQLLGISYCTTTASLIAEPNSSNP